MLQLAVILIVILSLATGYSYAEDGKDLCESTSTDDLTACAKDQLRSYDNRLNSVDRTAMGSAEGKEKVLKDVQLRWLKFRDSYCQDIANDVSPGNEAGIEKILCMALLTRDRADEIERLSTVNKEGRFFTFIGALEWAGYDRSDLLEKLRSSSGDDKTWSEYVSANCELKNEVIDEDVGDCRARVNFYRSY